MTWIMSRYRTGDIVEVRSKEEILATLDEQGCVDGLPFMPEMLRFCGQRVQVRAVAHKTCEVALQTAKGRRLQATVHLGDLRCDGSAHGGCQAECTLFWRDVWLKPSGDVVPSDLHTGTPKSAVLVCNEEQLLAQTLSRVEAEEKDPYYSCQATKLYGASAPLESWWDLHVRQYIFDVVSRNHALGRVLRVGWLAALRKLAQSVQGSRYVHAVCWRFRDWMHQYLTGRETPSLFRTIQPLEKTPTGRLDLKPGDWVRIKPKLEIEKTLNKMGKNRGLSFDPEEMRPYCGGTYRVRSSVTKIVDEATGKMRLMKEPCIILEGVVCNAEYAQCRLNCPRAIYSYWRELWLERVDAGGAD
jgi:hypothetical protein